MGHGAWDMGHGNRNGAWEQGMEMGHRDRAWDGAWEWGQGMGHGMGHGNGAWQWGMGRLGYRDLQQLII